MTDHYQGIPSHRFFSNMSEGSKRVCGNCYEPLLIPGSMRVYGGKYLANREPFEGPGTAEDHWFDKPRNFQAVISFAFQCQDCGSVQHTKAVTDKGYILETSERCSCGGMLSRAYPLFCPKCRYNYVKDFNAEIFIAGEKERGKTLADEERYVTVEIPKSDFQTDPEAVEDAISLQLELEGVHKEIDLDEEDDEITRYDVQYRFIERFHPEYIPWMARWYLLYSDEDELALIDPEQPNSVVLEVLYADVPLDYTLPGTFEIRMVSDDEHRVVIDRKIYHTPPQDAMPWFYENLDDILEKDWAAGKRKLIE